MLTREFKPFPPIKIEIEDTKWEISTCLAEDDALFTGFKDAGYEPFAVDQGIIYFKRRVKSE